MSKNETDKQSSPIVKEEPWFLQEALTVGLKLLHKKTEDCAPNEVVYVFIHRFVIVRIRVKFDKASGILSTGYVEQIGRLHYKEGEFAFDARPKDGLLFAVQDERKTIDSFLSILNVKLLEPEVNNVF